MTTTPTRSALDDTFRPVIREQIERMGLDVSKTAREAEVGRSELSLYLNGRRGIRLDKLGRLLDALYIELKPKRSRRGR